ncbi:MarR family winged helix-turn-helix transcriptional regulator [Acetobacter fallax]|uniref:MarR family transcriptional regulator n=1 Tax=Acetobacter fallax TaxID=1737473 RepID=A0ABX0K9U1_9PROT|nr:MarR family transcriptional regulator [Acetobacter fallax]NHO32573.1 MarR family transcriptional regulator [Acetobacter fallax]NHO36082.1 MarR family transcriptional regulator [Acetobacter fallax]
MPLSATESDETARDLTGRRRRFGHRLARLATLWRREIDHDLRQFNLTDATWRPLYYLRSLPSPVRQTDLARALSVEAPSLVRVLDVLEKQRLVSRDVDPDDRRSKLITLTPAGTVMADRVLRAADSVGERLLSDVSEEALNQSLAVFDQVWSVLQEGRETDRIHPDARPVRSVSSNRTP